MQMRRTRICARGRRRFIYTHALTINRSTRGDSNQRELKLRSRTSIPPDRLFCSGANAWFARLWNISTEAACVYFHASTPLFRPKGSNLSDFNFVRLCVDSDYCCRVRVQRRVGDRDAPRSSPLLCHNARASESTAASLCNKNDPLEIAFIALPNYFAIAHKAIH